MTSEVQPLEWFRNKCHSQLSHLVRNFLMQQGSCEKMMERLQYEISKTDGMQSSFPSIHHFGAAKYSDDHWYRY